MHFDGLNVDGVIADFIFICFLNLGVTSFDALELENYVGFAHFFSSFNDASRIVLFIYVGPTRQRNIGKAVQRRRL